MSNCEHSHSPDRDVSRKPADERTQPTNAHYHIDNGGFLVRCYHQCRSSVRDAGFWLGMTVGFPIEHYLYEKVWPFTWVTSWMGL